MQPRNRNYWEAKLRVDQINPSNLCISQRAHRPKIGQLLIGASVISPKLLTDCIDESRSSQQKLGDVLVESGHVPHRDVRSALLAQSLISDGVIGEATAIRMLARAAASQTEFLDVLTKNALEQDSCIEPDSVGLAEMLIEANFVSPEVIDEAKKRCSVSGIFLGRALLLMNAITADLLDAAFLALGLVRDGKLMQAEAVKVLKESRRSKTTVEDSIETLKLGPKRRQKSITLGRICVEAKLIDEFECLAALERALTEQTKLGDVLVRSGLIAEKPLRIALLLQGLAQLGVITLEKSAQALQTMQNDISLTFTRVAEDMKLFAAESEDENSIVFMLRTAAIVTKSDIEDASEKFGSYNMCTTKALLASGLITLSTYKTCLECVSAVKGQQYGFVDAVQILQLCHNSGFEYAEACTHMQQKKLEGQARTIHQTRSPKESLQESLKNFMAVPEYRQLVIAVPLLGVAALAVHLGCPPAFIFWGYWTVFLALAVVLFRAGRLQTNREMLQEVEKSLLLSQAKLTKMRLSKRNN